MISEELRYRLVLACVVVVPVLLLCMVPLRLYSQVPSTPTVHDVLDDTRHKQPLQITLHTSRPLATPADEFAITADIENVSGQPIFLNGVGIVMTPPPELDPQAPRAWYATLPVDANNYCEGKNSCDEQEARNQKKAEIISKEQDLEKCYGNLRKWSFIYHAPECLQKQEEKDEAEKSKLFNKVIRLEPGATTAAYWNGLTRTAPRGYLREYISRLFIPPAAYTTTIVTSYWTTEQGARQQSTERGSQSNIVNINIVAAQTTIIVGSIIGGLFAYFLLPATRFFPVDLSAAKRWQQALLYTRSILVSILFSTIVTIMLSRLTDSQFIIKVTVNDFWGAIAIGFIVSASGNSILRKLAGLVTSSRPQPDPEAIR